MSATVEFPSALQKYVNSLKTVEVPPGTVQQAFNTLLSRHAGLKEQLFDEQGRVRSFVNIYVNDEDIRHGKNLETVLRSGDVVQIVPSIAGGRSSRAG